MISIAIFIAVSCLAIYRPAIGIALTSQIYLIRSLTQLNNGEICFSGECAATSSPLLGLALPLFVFTISIAKTILLNRNQKTGYIFDYIDSLFVFFILTMLFGCLYSPDILESVDYFARFLLIGVSYYFVTKFCIINCHNKTAFINQFFLTTYIVSILLSIVALYYFVGGGSLNFRLTLPATHPIAFSLLIGQSVIISAAVFLSKGSLIGVKGKPFLNINLLIFIYLLIVQLSTNTRGVTVSLAVALFILLILSKEKINIKQVVLSIPVLIGGAGYVISKMDFDTLFNRFSNIGHDQSISDRIVAYKDSVDIFENNIFFGGGTNSFSHFSILGYPHNFFLENLVSFGMLGMVINISFILLLTLFFFICLSKGENCYALKVFYVLTVFFFIEIMFSFTIWMHKGLYLHLAFLGAYKSYYGNKN